MIARWKWQDAVAAISNVLFAVALWPTVVAVAPPAVATCAMTIVALIMLTVVMLSYRLWWGSFFQVCCMLMWVVLLIQGVWIV